MVTKRLKVQFFLFLNWYINTAINPKKIGFTGELHQLWVRILHPTFTRNILNLKSVEYPQIQPFRKKVKDYHAVETMLMLLSANFVLR